MTIPRNINRQHVLQAIREIQFDGVPRRRESRKFLVIHEGQSYPPKYVLSLATRHATGALLDPEVFSGGHEANSFLDGLGFRVVEIHVADRPQTP